jgi:putative endopeptidase
MMALTGLSELKDASQSILSLETELAEAHLEKEEVRDQLKHYKTISIDSLQSLMPGFNWSVYLKEANIADQDSLGMHMPDYMKDLAHIISSTEIDSWKVYLKWKVINRYASLLNEDLDQQHFEFYDKTLRGTREQRPRWRRGVSFVNNNIGELVGKLYVKDHFKPEAKARMLEMIANLVKAYGISIRELDWMSDETKVEALAKLSKFNSKIGYPDKWKEYEFEINAKDLFGNVIRSNIYEYNRSIDKLGQPIDKEEWFMVPQTVNAYYNASKNEIVFPAAILQPPFFDMSADDAVNYGAIGAVIGHEIGHGFDDSGSTYDGNGALRNWWTDQDREEFEKRTSQLIDQFNEFQVFPDLHVNGEYTLGENIGDLGGLSIALKAYHISLKGNEAHVMDGYTGNQRFFMGWAQVWNSKTRDEYLRTLINTDQHAPDEFRVNGVVRNIPAFYAAFNISERDSLYLKPENRVKIW